MNEITITVKYSCAACGIRRRDVKVLARDPAMIVTEYVEQVIGRAVGSDHAAQSPDCPSSVMSELLIPAPPDGDYIGQPRKN